jgi:hypothetical protein
MLKIIDMMRRHSSTLRLSLESSIEISSNVHLCPYKFTLVLLGNRCVPRYTVFSAKQSMLISYCVLICVKIA